MSSIFHARGLPGCVAAAALVLAALLCAPHANAVELPLARSVPGGVALVELGPALVAPQASGVASISLAAAAFGQVVVTLPDGRFSEAPHVAVGAVSNTFIAGQGGGATATSITIWARHYTGTAQTQTVVVQWIASIAT